MLEVLSRSTEKTMDIGKKLGQLLKAGDIITLVGDLGAGKTHFAKGVAQGLAIDEHVTSPTFTIINEYLGRLPLYHIDAYRLEEPDEAYDLGLEEYLFGEGVTLIEWPQILKELLPEELLEIEITKNPSEEDVRILKFKGTSPRYEEIVRELKKEC